MTSPDRALLARINSDVAVIWSYLGRVSADLRELDRLATGPVVAPPPWPAMAPQPTAVAPPTNAPTPVATTSAPPAVRPEDYPPDPPRPDGWIGKALAVAGVAVTLVGVVLLLVLAAQAGLLRPGVRVGAGALLAGALIAVAGRLYPRPGGRVGAIALSATGIATAYIDVVAVTTIYGWIPGGMGLVVAAVVAGGGLTLARRWNSEPLALLVLIPLLVLGPVVAGGITLLVVGFMLVLSAATLPVQLGRDWLGMLAARIAVATLPLLAALLAVAPDSGRAPWLAAACGIAALLALSSALVLLPHGSRPSAIALLATAGTLPLLASSIAVDHTTSAVMIALLAGALLALACFGDRLVPGAERAGATWAAASAVSGVIAVAVGFDGQVAGPLLLAISFVVAVAGRRSAVARWAAVGFGVVGGMYYLMAAPLTNLVSPIPVSGSTAAATMLSSLLVIASAAASCWSWVRCAEGDRELVGAAWIAAAGLSMYAGTMFTVTLGVLVGGQSGFFAGHVAATICWIALAAIVLRQAAKMSRTERSLPIGAGMAVVAAAMSKLFLFDLGTLDGIFRVVVFIVVGLALLAMGTGYARMLSQQDEERKSEPV